ncbi:MAG: hypothetical protein J6A55_02755 [Oscillospiraceae bacterium]|nr:hypothetical protein [Oscillospiraceae bacterium]
MIIIIDENYFAQPRCRLLGNKGETMSRRLEVRFPKVENAQLYKLRFLLPDNTTCYELDVTSGEAYVSGSLLVQVGKVLCQWIAVGIGEDEQYEVVAKSNVFEMFVDDSIDSDSESIPTYEQAADMFDRAVSTLEEVEKIVPQFSELSNKVVKNDKKLTELWVRHDADILNTQNSIVELGWRHDDEMEALTQKHDADIKNVSDKVESEISNVTDLINNAAMPIISTAYGDSISVTDSVEKPLCGLFVYGKTTQDGTPTPENPIELSSVSELISVSITDGADKAQSMLVMTPEGLRGVPVSSGGNYTDDSGQQWICDEVDFERNIYIKKVAIITFDGVSLKLAKNDSAIGSWLYTAQINLIKPQTASICTHFSHKSSWALGHGEYTSVMGTTNNVFFSGRGIASGDNATVSNANEMNEWLKTQNNNGTPVTVFFLLEKPIETPLTAEQIEAFKALHSYYPNTTVTNDSGAGMKISYTADTKTYIDNQFKVLFALISTM